MDKCLKLFQKEAKKLLADFSTTMVKGSWRFVEPAYIYVRNILNDTNLEQPVVFTVNGTDNTPIVCINVTERQLEGIREHKVLGVDLKPRLPDSLVNKGMSRPNQPIDNNSNGPEIKGFLEHHAKGYRSAKGPRGQATKGACPKTGRNNGPTRMTLRLRGGSSF